MNADAARLAQIDIKVAVHRYLVLTPSAVAGHLWHIEGCILS